ncbi:DUF4240 domain-containing protein [Kitasatospora sp. KL5]|uniref:DUF4240 domain-containing protein n=1 Tax=Kitasatospora sp. KL5 TaxID=3425125 RepID=UPI003D6FB360
MTAQPEPAALPWDRFWELIDTLGGPAGTSRCADLEDGCERLTGLLAAEPVEVITGFGERLAEALYRLDLEQLGTMPVHGMSLPDGSPFPQSDDGFLYSRAAVVAAGRATYTAVLARPELFAPFTDAHAECLLYVHEEAYEEATGTEWDIDTRYDYESCSNEEGWPGLAR